MARSHKICQLLKLLLFIEIMLLIINAALISRDYQDSWTLEGLEIPFAIFMVTNTLYFLVEKDIRWLVLFATLSRFIIFLVPCLKYEWFLGTAIDQHQQFRAARFICDNGRIESGRPYSETPLMHIFFAVFCEITNTSLVDTFKYLPVFSWFIYPIVVYSIIIRTFPQREKSDLLKWAILASLFPVTPYLSITVTGTVFGSLFAFLCLSESLKASTRRRKDLVLAIFFSFALLMTHFISSILLMLGFLMAFLAIKIFKGVQSSFFISRFSIFLITLNLAWIIIQLIDFTVLARPIENTFIVFVKGLMGIPTTRWSPTGMRPRFFELNPMDAIRVLTVFYGGDIIVLLLAFFGTFVALRMWKQIPQRFLLVYFLSLWAFVPFQLLLTQARAALFQYHRVIRHTLLVCPIFIAVFLHYVDKRVRWSKTMIAALVSVTILLSTIQTFGYQPFLPTSSAIDKSLPSDEPVVFLGWIGVNSIYQRSMIQHIEEYASEEMQLASDYLTRNQIVGLTGYEYSDNQLVDYNPLIKLIDEDVHQKDYDVFLIHLPGKAGGLSEKAEISTKRLILETVLNSSIVYTNGESQVLIYPGVEG